MESESEKRLGFLVTDVGRLCGKRFDDLAKSTLDLTRAPGNEWSYAGYTADRFRYPYDPYFHLYLGGQRGMPMVRDIDGHRNDLIGRDDGTGEKLGDIAACRDIALDCFRSFSRRFRLRQARQ